MNHGPWRNGCSGRAKKRKDAAMSKNLLIRMTIPVQAQRIVSVPSLLFGRWLPTKEEDCIVVDDSNLSPKRN